MIKLYWIKFERGNPELFEVDNFEELLILLRKLARRVNIGKLQWMVEE